MPNPIADITGTPAGVAVEPTGTASAASNVRARGAVPETESSTTPRDATSLTPLGSLLNRVTQAAGAQSSFRPEVVARIKAQIAAGTYKPDSNAVAAKVYRAIKANQ